MRQWRLELWGVPRLVAAVDDGALKTLPLSANDAACLALIALGGGVATRRVASLVWPRETERQSLNNLNQRLHRLRVRCGERPVLVRLGAAPVLADDLVAVLPAADDLRKDPQAASHELLQPFAYADAPDFQQWLDAERASWATRRREGIVAFSREAEEAGLLTRAIAYARRLQAEEPYSEDAVRRLMRLHYLNGDLGAAIAAFEHCERVLADELGMRPSDETIALLSTIEQRQRHAPAQRSAPGSPIPVELLHPPRTVGRDAEQALLRQAHGHGLIAVVVGEAGSGKSRLLQDFAATHAAVICVQARRHDGDVPYALLGRIVREVARTLPRPIDRALQRRLGPIVGEWSTTGPAPRFDRSAASALKAAMRDLLVTALSGQHDTLMLDDLHFADTASLEALQDLLDDEALRPWRWVLAHRPPLAVEPDHAFARCLAQSARTTTIELGALDLAATRCLLESLKLGADGGTALAEYLLRRVGGQPQHLLVALQAWRHHDLSDASVRHDLPPPRQVAELLQRRIARLSEDAAAVARVAAVSAPDFSLDLAAYALERNALTLADAWRELEAAGVLQGEAFSHDLAHEAVALATPRPVAAHIHRLTARFLVARGKAEPAGLARHWLAAGEHREAAAALVAAANRAMRAGRARERAGLLCQAAQAAKAAGDLDMAMRTGTEAAQALLLSDGAGAALALTDALLLDADSLAHEGMAQAVRAQALQLASQRTEAMAAARAALERLPPSEAYYRLFAMHTLAILLAESGDTTSALQLLEEGRGCVGDAVDELQLMYWGICANSYLAGNRLEDARDAAGQQLHVAERLQAVGEAIAARMNLCALALRAGDASAALEHAIGVETLTRDRSEHAPLARWNDVHMALALIPLGRLNEALQRLESACRVLAADGNAAMQCVAENALAQLFVHLGQPDKAQRCLQNDCADLPAHRRATRLTMRAVVERAAGTGRAPALLSEAIGVCVGEVAAHARLTARLESLREIKDPALAWREAAVCEHEAESSSFGALTVLAAWRQLDALLALGRFDAASELAVRLRRQAVERRSPAVWLPAVLVACADAFDKAGQQLKSDACLEDAQRWLVDVALPHVPHGYDDSFRRRNPAHRLLRERLQAQGRTVRF